MLSRERRWLLIAPLVLFVLLGCWITVDLSTPVHSDLRRFDPHSIARMETAMWRSYYDHHAVRLLNELAGLLRAQYHLRFWQSYAAAYHGARAAVVFQRGHRRAEYEQALPDLRAFYSRIRAASDTPFDIEKVSRLELEWWIVHRQRAEHHPDELVQALAALQAEIYGEPVERFRGHAAARAEAMQLRDASAAAGGVSEGDWSRIETLLDTSWTSLSTAVTRPVSTARN